jgi:hypothetical protein
MNESAEPEASAPYLIGKATGSKTLKRNEFENHIEWSKTCDLHGIRCYLPRKLAHDREQPNIPDEREPSGLTPRFVGE